ncbi:serine/threonine-protein kinase TBK1-like [Saccostrea echinata]|uniref:serine/threonine-protein kinase TBK1-like n=1 Tax=Saccostrea echinata TaxID=191078 RepID=UPI002A83399F|nr:serine/threonine-protein kinase TBK1-like [Saccostrea echinata]
MSSGSEKTYSYSLNYQWNTGELLGRGATAVVYKARNKTSGEVFAVKVFHERVSAFHSSVPKRELELLLKMKHRNIIGILGLEKEVTTGNDVIIMEYCSGGSLYSMLDKPKYSFGFPEEEFLIALHDISDGIEYLRKIQITHRDIKPGNIMRKIDENGKSVYMLTDFGAARALEEEETFTSIYGTEEYLDPNMYERAVLRMPTGNVYDADVDLWSLGVTIYHVATGSLPFQPYGGRSNAKTMHYITTQKKSGVISGIQRTEGGDIEWHTELPRTCYLSSSLKSLITPIIAGLLESNRAKRWTFDNFFKATSEIMNKITVKVFDVSTGLNDKIYIDKSDRYAQFQERLAVTTEIAAGEQLILFHNRELSEIIEGTLEMQNWPKNILRGQLYLYQREKLDQQRLVLPEIPPLPQFPSKVNLDRDCYVAHKMAAISCLIERYVASCITQQEIMLQSETFLRDFILRITRKINNCIPDMCKVLMEHKSRQELFYSCFESMWMNGNVIHKAVKTTAKSQLKHLLDKLQDVYNDRNPWTVLNKAESRSQECKVYMEVLMQKIKEQEDEAIAVCVGCLEEDHCFQKAEYISSKVCDIHHVFLRQKKQRILPEEESFGHEADRSKLMDLCVQIVSLLQSHCLLNLTKVYNVVGKQISLLLKNLQRTKKVEQNITSVTECCEKLSKRMGKMEKECKEVSAKLSPVIQLILQNSHISTKDEDESGYGSKSKGADSGIGNSNEHNQYSGSSNYGLKSTELKQERLGVQESMALPKSMQSIAHKLESGFQTLHDESIAISESLEQNKKLMERQAEMVDELKNIRISGSSETDPNILLSQTGGPALQYS